MTPSPPSPRPRRRPPAAPRALAMALAAVLLAAAGPSRAQAPGAAASDTLPAARPELAELTGTYRLEDGRLLVAWDLVDQMPGGAHQLAVFEPETGWLRTLHHESGARYGFGAGWFAPEPREGSLTFDPPAGRLLRVRGGDTLAARRVPLRRRELVVSSGEVELAAELILPPEGVGSPPYPGLVVIPGFGPLTRRTPRIVADQFAAAGLAVLIHDKRGTGGSTGSYVPGAIPDFARDAAAALVRLRARPEVDGRRVGVMASSLGGLVAPLVHEREPGWAFFVCRVCPATPSWEQKLVAVLQQGRAAELPDADLLDAMARKALAARYALTGEDYGALESVERSTAGEDWRRRVGSPEDWAEPWPRDSPNWEGYRGVLEVDPGRLLRELEAPTLLVLGERDDRVPGDYHAMRARRIFERAGRRDRDHQAWVLPRASHGLMVIERGGGERLPFRRFVPGWHGRMVRWVADRVGAGR